jgi:hypothetical protein
MRGREMFRGEKRRISRDLSYQGQKLTIMPRRPEQRFSSRADSVCQEF